MYSRREFLEIGGMAAAATGLLGCAGTRPGMGGGAPSAAPGIGTFAAFGVDERMIRETLAAVLSRGADFGDIFFQHRVSSTLVLEDGAVNQAYQTVSLGAGVRAVRGDQTGYGYTEELTLDSLRRAAQTAAAIADGPARTAPQSFNATPRRYPPNRSGCSRVRARSFSMTMRSASWRTSSASSESRVRCFSMKCSGGP